MSRVGRDAEAVALLRKVLDGRTKRLGPDHPDTLRSTDNLTVALKADELETTAAIQKDLVARATRVLGPSHPSTLMYRHNLCLMLFRGGKLGEVVAESGLGIMAMADHAGPPEDLELQFRGLRASALIEARRLEEAEKAVREHVDLCLKAFGERGEATLQARTLEYDLAEAKDSLPEMRAAAESLRGTKYEERVFQQLKAAEAKMKESGG
jgi:hypothetical protein